MKFNFEATGVGSAPFKDAKLACKTIFDNFKSIPFWPQLPKRSYLESMYIQYSERLPGLVLDEANKSMHIDTSKVAETIEEVYGKYLELDTEYFKISDSYAAGLYAFLDYFDKGASDVKFVKGHITGPISFGLSVTDQNKRSIIYDKDLFEILTKTLIMKAKWQIKKLKKVFPSLIMFIDEPYLVSIGSSYVNIDANSAMAKLEELIGAIKTEGVLVGVHCCGNTDWGMILNRSIDILSFDAYNFSKELLLYPFELKGFLGRGGTLAWGMVPSADTIGKETKTGLSRRFAEATSRMESKGIEKSSISSLVTPSCGVGTLDEDTALKVFRLTSALSKELNGK